jgi:hypothetical protein
MLDDDDETSRRALQANNMHYRDAELVRYLVKRHDIISIHDCFGVRLCDLHLLIDDINLYYSSKIGMKTYCMHILK